MTDSTKGPQRTGILVPVGLVERSAFVDKGSGINDSESLTLTEKISAWFYDGELHWLLIFSRKDGYNQKF